MLLWVDSRPFSKIRVSTGLLVYKVVNQITEPTMQMLTALTTHPWK